MTEYNNSSERLTDWQIAAEWLTRARVTDPTQEWRGRMAAVLLLAFEAVALITLIAGISLIPVAGGPTRLSLSGQTIGVVLAFLWLLLYLVNRFLSTPVAGVGLAVTLLGVAFATVVTAGPLSPHAITLVVPVIIAGMFGPPISAVVLALITAAGYMALNQQADSTYLSRLFSGGAATQSLIVYVNLGIVAGVTWLFSRTTRQVLIESQTSSLALATRHEELTTQLKTQARQFQATVAVARTVISERNLDRLLRDATRLVRDTFGYSHVQIFLVDADRGYAVLRQSTGEAGQALIERGHRLTVGSLSVIGQVTASGRAIIAREGDQDIVHRHHEFLPGVRAEAALPLNVENRVIGVLDLQSESVDGFTEAELPALQSLADLLAIAIQNAYLFEEAENNLRELRELSRETAQRSWAEFLAEASQEERQQAFGPETTAIQVQRSRVIEQVLSAGGVIVSSGRDGQSPFLAAPVVVRNEVVGVLAVEADGPREWTQEDLRLIEGIASRTALAIENARLYIQAQRAAERERMVNAIAARLQRAPSLALLLESATRELAEALGTDNVYAEINLDRPFARSRRQVSGPEDEEAGDETAESDQARPDSREEASPGMDALPAETEAGSDELEGTGAES